MLNFIEVNYQVLSLTWVMMAKFKMDEDCVLWHSVQRVGESPI